MYSYRSNERGGMHFLSATLACMRVSMHEQLKGTKPQPTSTHLSIAGVRSDAEADGLSTAERPEPLLAVSKSAVVTKERSKKKSKKSK